MSEQNISRRQAIALMAAAIAAPAGMSASHADTAEAGGIENAGFETGELAPWRVSQGTAQVRMGEAHTGTHALTFGAGPSGVEQTITVRPNRNYQLTGWLKSGSGAEEVHLGIRDYSGVEKATASALVAFTRVAVEFTTGASDHQATVFLLHPSGNSTACADALELLDTGEAKSDTYAGVTNSISVLPTRIPVTDFDIAQQPNDTLRWMQDAKFGMFIHWGLYAGPGQGEWYMHHAAMPPGEYRKYASPESGDLYFAADRYDPGQWAQVAKSAGMKWMCLTARHHDGYCLFDSPHPNAFTSMQTHRRDLFGEYARAVREAGLKVGVYYSPLSWRYPGYYDVTGTDCKKNPFGYVTDPAHKANARVMKEENYANVRQLMSAYGKIDHIFWDGGWLGEQQHDRDAAFFHEPGHFLDPHNPWPVGKQYLDYDTHGRALGMMGLVRKHQPHVLANPRYGWIGDFGDEEGGAAVTGPIRTPALIEKCLTMHGGGWGYSRNAIAKGDVMSRDKIIGYLANCVVRNMVMLLNFGPDRHGQMPLLVEQHLRETGAWLAKVGDAIYGTRGGPWQPRDGQYGFCHRGNMVYVHILEGYAGESFTLPPIGTLRPMGASDVFTKKPLPIKVNPDRTVTISSLDRATNPVDTVIAVRFDTDVMAHALASPA